MKPVSFLLCCFCFTWNVKAGEDRIWMDITISNQPVHLAFDTGADVTVLFRSAAQRLKLKLVPSPMPDKVTNQVTELCPFKYGHNSGEIQFVVVDLPTGAHTEMDGVVSWNAFRNDVIVFDDAKGPNIGTAVPSDALTWPTFKQRTDLPKLAFDAGGGSGRHWVIYVDTGDEGGVVLNHTLWEEWAARHSQQPATMKSAQSLMGEVSIKREIWADHIAIGGLVLTNVPVREISSREAAQLPDHTATLGLYALRRLDFIFDGPNGTVYARARGDIPPIYRHNHLGAVFDPGDDTHDALPAHVAAGSPADLAGIIDGDVLLRVDDVDVTKWRSDSVFERRRFWEAPPGTTYKLTLKRGDHEYQTTVTLKKILGCPGQSPFPPSLASLRSKAEQGDAQAQNELGSILHNGAFGVAVDLPEAARWIRKAADQSLPAAQYALGLLYARGEGVPKDTVQAFQWFHKAAEQNLPGAQHKIGLYYDKGFGVEKDIAKALAWYRKAAEQNDPDAQTMLGLHYMMGTGVQTNEVEAAKFFRKAAFQNNADGQDCLSRCYVTGQGVARDFVQGYKWALLAAKKGNEDAEQRLPQFLQVLTPAQIEEAQKLADQFEAVQPSPSK
jgi:hypothetical protein